MWLCGIEYLFSVPALLGGAVVMNAGRGKKYNVCISDYILEVKVLRDGIVSWIPKEKCEFAYRSSVFRNKNMIVLAAKFCFPVAERDHTAKLREERIALCRQKQDNSAPNFGTVFCESNKIIMQMFKVFPIRKKNGIVYSAKTVNWMLNLGGSFDMAISLIEITKFIHKLFGQKCRTEVIMWK